MDQAKIDALRAQPVPAFSHLIDGQHVPASDGGTMDIISPIDGTVLTTTAKGTSDDMTAAIAAARAAFEDGRWAGQPPAARKKVLMKWADLIEANALELAVLGVRDNGTEIGMALKAEPGSAAATIRYYAEALDKIYGEIAATPSDILGMIHKEPVGVVGAIIPWNFPMMIGAWKLGPALAMGNSVVVKPSETASLSLMRMCALALEAGLPPGVLNAVTGEGAVVGETMGLSMDVDVLVFTGSGATGRRLMGYAAQSNMKRVYLELGGKSPNIVFADAPNLQEAANVTAGGIFRNAGQVCVAGSRLLVERAIHDDFVAAVAKAAEAMRVGDPLLVDTAAERQPWFCRHGHWRRRHGGHWRTAGSGGNRRFLYGADDHHRRHAGGDADPERSFWPRLRRGVTPFDTIEDAISLANGTVYGLAGAAWTANLSKAHCMVREVRTGVMHINTYGGADGTVPLGGVGQSGNGSDKSLHAIEKYVNLKTAWIKL